MSSFPWLKLWIGTADDPKLRAAARRAGCHKAIAVNAWIAVLEHAGEHQDRGSVKGLLPEVLAEICDTTREIAVRLFQAFRELGMLIGERIAKWVQRQTEKLARPISSNAERIRRCRQKKKHLQGVLDIISPPISPISPISEAFHPTISSAVEEDKEEESESTLDSESVAAREVVEDREGDSFWRSAPFEGKEVVQDSRAGTEPGSVPRADNATPPVKAGGKVIEPSGAGQLTSPGDRAELPEVRGEPAMPVDGPTLALQSERTQGKPQSHRRHTGDELPARSNVVQLSPAAREMNKKELRRQKVMRFVLNAYDDDEQLRRMNGLCGTDLEHDEQWWFDVCDREMIRANWDDVRDGTRDKRDGWQRLG